MTINNSWKSFIEQELKKPYFDELKNFIKSELDKEKEIYPEPKCIFRAFELTEYDEVKLVCIGQDPYSTPNVANGLAFAINDGNKLQPSLQNIFKEIEWEYGTIPKNSSLINWAGQGVLLLNSILTVEKNKPLSHAGKGWEIFIEHTLQYLNEKEKPIVFMLWGRNAQRLCSKIDRTKHCIIETSHPSPFSFSKGFWKSNCFTIANNFLKKHYNGIEINWSNS